MNDFLLNILSSPESFGSFICTLKFDSVKGNFFNINETIIKLFCPNEIHTALFLLDDNYSMQPFEIFDYFEDDNSIRKIIFVKEKEKIIVEYYKGIFVIEHSFRLNNEYSISNDYSIGINVINNFIKQDNIELVLGFEISLHIDHYKDSLKEHKKDKSLHPIIVILKDINNVKKEEFISDSSHINKKKMEILNSYIQNLEI